MENGASSFSMYFIPCRKTYHQRDKSAKEIDYKNEVIRDRKYLSLLMFIAGLHGDIPITVLG